MPDGFRVTLRRAGVLVLALACAPALAAAFPAGLAVTYSNTDDDDFAAAELSGDGNVTGTYGVVANGTSTNIALASVGDPMLTGVLAATGDGVGYAIQADASDGRYGAGIDFTIAFQNGSANALTIVIAIDHAQNATAGGDDAFVDSEFTLVDAAMVERFFTQIETDIANGNVVNGVPQLDGNGDAIAGGTVMDAALRTFTFTLMPGATESLTGKYTLRGLADNGVADANARLGVRIAEVRGGPPPIDVPAPGMLACVVLLPALLAVSRRRGPNSRPCREITHA